jgi:hypothetical protein
MNVPRNVLWFEVLLYLSLALDALSVAFQDRTPSAQMSEQMITVSTVMAAGLILLLVYFSRPNGARAGHAGLCLPRWCFR